jgi:hypothetical protein
MRLTSGATVPGGKGRSLVATLPCLEQAWTLPDAMQAAGVSNMTRSLYISAVGASLGRRPAVMTQYSNQCLEGQTLAAATGHDGAPCTC